MQLENITKLRSYSTHNTVDKSFGVQISIPVSASFVNWSLVASISRGQGQGESHKDVVDSTALCLQNHGSLVQTAMGIRFHFYNVYVYIYVYICFFFSFLVGALQKDFPDLLEP